MAKLVAGPKPTSVGIAGLYLDKTTRALVLRAVASDADSAESGLPSKVGGLVECRNAKLARALEKVFKEHGSATLSLALRAFPSLASSLESKYGKRSDFDRFLTDVENEFSREDGANIHVVLGLDMDDTRVDKLRSEHPSISFTQILDQDDWLANVRILLEALSSKDGQNPKSDATELCEALGSCLAYCAGEKAHPFAWRARKADESGQAQENTA